MSREFQDIFTPDILTEEILAHIPLSPGDKVLEPSAGDGNMIKCLIDKGEDLDITAIEIQLGHIINMKKRFSDRSDVKVEIKEIISVFDVFFG